MILNKSMFLMIILAGLVTWIPRITPFLLSRNIELSPTVHLFLDYVPMCILLALFFQNIFIVVPNHFPKIDGINLLASIPCAIVAFRTKDLMWTVIVGIVSMALLRLVF